LDVWRSVLRTSFRDGSWVWGGRDESSSSSDAEQLLCLLYPATSLNYLALDRPDAMADDVTKALEPFGEPRTIPHKIIDVLLDYIDRYTEDGEPSFGSGSYLHTGADDEVRHPTAEQIAIGLVDSYSLSVSLCLSALGFLDIYKPNVRREKMRATIQQLEKDLSKRLTAAMIGLLRSFVVRTIGRDDPARAIMLSMVNQNGSGDEAVVDRLLDRLGRVRARLRDDVRIGVDIEEIGLDEDDRLFECGWAWGIHDTSIPIEIDSEKLGFDTPPRIASEAGVADSRPYLYSTVLALDGINDLRAARTRELNLLNDEQRKLNDALQIRWDLTQRYWSTIARFGDGDWPLEDMPWRTSDGEESDYFTLLVSAVLIQDLENRTATDDDLNRAVLVLESLAQRGRITRRVTADDQAVEMHVPGVRMRLSGTKKIGPQLFLNVGDFAPLLMKRALQAARLSANVDARDKLLRLAEATMDHLSQRVIEHGPAAGLWDDPNKLLFPRDPDRKAAEQPSWYLTERVVEAMVVAAETYEQTPLRSTTMLRAALEALHEADHLLNRKLLEADSGDTSSRRAELDGIETKLLRARRIATERPGTAYSLATEALRTLDRQEFASQDAARGI
jgi:hypothetical protein